MTIYLIGPSSIGKTCCAEYACRLLLNTTHVDLDKRCSGMQFDWPFCEAALLRIREESQTNRQHTVVDIGAGTQTRPELIDYLRPRKQNVLLVWAQPHEAFARNRDVVLTRSLLQYEACEYTSRAQLYSLTEHKIDVTGQSKEKSQMLFLDYLMTNFGLRRKDTSGD